MQALVHAFKNRKGRAITAIMVAVIVLCIMLFSVFFIAAETHHDCTGDDCPVCAMVQMCETAVQQVGDGAPLLAAVILTLAAAAISGNFKEIRLVPATPVFCKVRMNR